MAPVFALRNAIKTYEWGKLGLNSLVAQLQKSSFDQFDVGKDTPYSEMWMGTHLSGMSVIPALNDVSLLEWITQHPDSLGTSRADNSSDFGLPFLFKVLSVRKALSIQVHPDKRTAEKLHEQFGDRYPDDNHKPELAIALTKFQALCGFRPLSEIKAFITELNQLEATIGKETVLAFLESSDADDQKLIKAVFTALMTKRDEDIRQHLNSLVEHMENCSSLSDLCKSVRDVFLHIHKEYPGDVGCFCIFFFNYLSLEPGQAIYLAANEPHAYLEGDCIECMACSDNVVRAGLTPKFKDVDTLCEILTYKCKPSDENIFQCTGDVSDPYVKIYDPPTPEFTIAKIEVNSPDIRYALHVLDCASILIVVDGKAAARNVSDSCPEHIPMHKGVALFISAGAELEVQTSAPKLLMFRAYCNV